MRIIRSCAVLTSSLFAACGGSAEPPAPATLPGEEVVAEAGVDPPGRDETAPGEEAEPEVEFPSCRPLSAAEKAPMPWKIGEAAASGWSATTVTRENPEFIRVQLSHAEAGEMTLEVKYNEAGASEWATESYQLMPGVGMEAPEDLLNEQMALLRGWNEATEHVPFVEKREGVLDRYAGLPACEE